MNRELKGALVGASCVAATASAWTPLSTLVFDRFGHAQDPSFSAGVWVCALLAGMPVAVYVGRRAGEIAARAARHRVRALLAIAIVTACVVSLLAAVIVRVLYRVDLLGPLLGRALACALLGAVVLERWARPAQELPAARMRGVPRG